MRRGGRFIFASSAAVYGIPESVPSFEDDELAPISPYGESKVEAENAIRKHRESFDFEYNILRFFNIAGSYAGETINSDPRFEKNLFAQILNKYRAGEKFVVEGSNFHTMDGTCERDFVDISWLSNFLSHLLLCERHLGDITVNVGCGRPTSILQLVKELANRRNDFKYEIGQPRAVEIPRSYAGIERLESIAKQLEISLPPKTVTEIAKSIGV